MNTIAFSPRHPSEYAHNVEQFRDHMCDIELFERELLNFMEDLDAFGNHLCDIRGL